MDLSDEKLVAQHLGGDESAFPMLLERYVAQIYNFAWRLGGGDESDDIAQETFVKAWKNLKKYSRKHAQFRTWLFAIARNTTIDHLRKKKHMAFSDFENSEQENILIETTPDTALRADELFERAEHVEILEAALEALPHRAREVIILRYRHELTFEEIGQTLGEPLNTVKSRHRRALIALRSIIETHQKKP